MSTLNEALGVDLSGSYAPVDKPYLKGVIYNASLEPVFNPMLRCPLPQITTVSPDSLRQFYIGGQIPQTRVLTPPSVVPTNTSGNTYVTNTTVVQQSGGGGGSSTGLIAKSSALTTATINPNDNFLGSLIMSKSFQLLSLATSNAARIRAYSNQAAQTLDLSRGLDIAPAPGTIQNLIFDVVLDTIPYTWSLQNVMGANADAAQTTLIYMTVTNVDITSFPITVTVGYVPLES